ncbi:hypothetical protein [Mycobacteroides abscessus]
MKDEDVKACWEQIPGINRDVNFFVREGFWYAAALMDRGWEIVDFTPVGGSRGGFVGITPDHERLTVNRGTERVGELACVLAGHMGVMAQNDSGMLEELMELIRWRETTGPITQPSTWQTVDQQEIADQIGSLTETFAARRFEQGRS